MAEAAGFGGDGLAVRGAAYPGAVGDASGGLTVDADAGGAQELGDGAGGVAAADDEGVVGEDGGEDGAIGVFAGTDFL